MRDIGQEIVDEARTWLNTKWVHQGRLKGYGVDCAGFIVGTAENVKNKGVDSASFITSIAEQAGKLGDELGLPTNYKRRENGEQLIELLETHMTPVERSNIKKGDVLALIEPGLREPSVPRHLAIVTEVGPGEELKIIHASEKGVREHRTNSLWRKRIHSVWRLNEELLGK